MKKFAVLALAVVFAACGAPDPVTPLEDLEVPVALSTTNADACWGQATAVFAKMGAMGAHSSQQANPPCKRWQRSSLPFSSRRRRSP